MSQTRSNIRRMVALPFENLTGLKPSHRRYGVAHIGYDGEGGYDCISIVLFSQFPGRAPFVLLPGTEKFRTVREVFFDEVGPEAITARINADFERSGYMAIHDRNMPRDALPVAA